MVATPLGNLRDITLRALDLLGSVDWIAAEDTRVSGRLLQHYGLKSRLLAVHEHNERAAAERIVELLREGASVALVSDAGTPAVSDPGALVVAAVRAAGFRVEPVPGASAVIAAMCASGLSSASFLFYGFLPARQSARREALAALHELPHALAFYEAPHRIAATLADLAECFGGERRVLIARELTKVFEEIAFMRLDETAAWLRADTNRERGEFVLVLEAPPAPSVDRSSLDLDHVLAALLDELPVKQAVQIAARITGEARNALYARALALKRKA